MDDAPPASDMVPAIRIGSSAPLRVAVYRMAETGTTMLAVVDPDGGVGGVIRHDES